MKILVIDDDDRIRRMVEKTLCADGHEVIGAADGAAGMVAFKKHQPDAVVTDIIMPEQEGIETIVTIRRERPQTKIIAISGGGRMGDIDLLRMARMLGADDVLPKPFRPQELRRRIQALAASVVPATFPA